MAIQYVQAQKFQLAGSGVTSTDTSITLASMKLPDGTTNITMTDLGDTGYMTLEPGTSREESISFTGITQNANGTATLTGVTRGLNFVSPYTSVAAYKQSHAGGAVAIISDTSAFGGAIMDYIATAIVSGAVPATTTTNGLTKMSVAPVSAASPIAVGDNDGRVPTQSENDALNATTSPSSSNKFITQKDFQIGAEVYAADAQANDTYVITLSPAPAAYATGMTLRFKANTANTGAATLNVNSLGAKTIKKNGSSDLATGDILANQILAVVYDGTNFQLISPTSSTFTSVTSGTTTKNMGDASATQTIAHGLGVAPRIVELHAAGQANWSMARITASGTSYFTYFNGGFNQTDIGVYYGGAGADQYHGTITVDATNISIAWVKTGTTSGNCIINWKVMA